MPTATDNKTISAGLDDRRRQKGQHEMRTIFSVLDEVIQQVRLDQRMSDALDAYAPGHKNAAVRQLSRLGCYEIILRFDAMTFDGEKS